MITCEAARHAEELAQRQKEVTRPCCGTSNQCGFHHMSLKIDAFAVGNLENVGQSGPSIAG